MTAAVRWQAPGRINLIGEHTDYNDGFALPFAIGKACTAVVSASGGGRVRVRSAGIDEPVELAAADIAAGRRPEGDGAWATYPLGVLNAMFGAGRLRAEDVSLDIDLRSDVPFGAGLSSSAAIVCSVATAIDDLYGLHLDDAALLAVSRAAENDYVGAPTGGMDQLASLRCTAGHVLLCDMRSLQTEAVAFDVDAAGLRVLVVDSKAPHAHADGEYRARRAACEQAAAELGVAALRDAELDAVERLDDPQLRRRARHIVTENRRVLDTVALLRTGRVRDIGPLLTASHASMRDDFEITVGEVDLAVETLLDSGALGARMTGGGFGGCVIAVIDAGSVGPASAAVEKAFADAGYTPPQAWVESPAQGAHKIV